MPTITEFVEALAAATDLRDRELHHRCRLLREAGHLPSGGRGPGAAKLDTQAAANILISLIGTDVNMRGPDATRYFGSLQASPELFVIERYRAKVGRQPTQEEIDKISAGDFLGIRVPKKLQTFVDLTLAEAVAHIIEHSADFQDHEGHITAQRAIGFAAIFVRDGGELVFMPGPKTPPSPPWIVPGEYVAIQIFARAGARLISTIARVMGLRDNDVGARKKQ